MEDGFVLISSFDNETMFAEQGHLTAIERFIRDLEPSLQPLNSFIHDNPELAFEEQKAHDALTDFMRNREKWDVTKSAFGMKTAWMAVYDSGRRGPVISFNAEMGMVA
jgi:metal-dependent amidase/aminoacylase/carboxypeptidase family protein